MVEVILEFDYKNTTVVLKLFPLFFLYFPCVCALHVLHVCILFIQCTSVMTYIRTCINMLYTIHGHRANCTNPARSLSHHTSAGLFFACDHTVPA